MKKVKVHRYVSGKRPDYAPTASSDEDSEGEDFLERHGSKYTEDQDEVTSSTQSRVREEDDPRLRRLTRIDRSQSYVEERHRYVQDPEALEVEPNRGRERIKLDSDTSEDEELSDSEIERRREALKQKVLAKKSNEEEMKMDLDDVKSEDSSDSSEYEEYTDSEEEMGPRLKPVFVRKKDRITVMEKEKEAIKQKQVEVESRKAADERRRNTLRVRY